MTVLECLSTYVLSRYTIAGVTAVSDANNVSRLSNGIACADDMIWLIVNLKPDANDWHGNQGSMVSLGGIV